MYEWKYVDKVKFMYVDHMILISFFILLLLWILYKDIYCTYFGRFRMNRNFWKSCVSYFKRCFSFAYSRVVIHSLSLDDTYKGSSKGGGALLS